MDLSLNIGKYDVLKEIGKGATGTVYLAKDTFSGKQVALKIVDPALFEDPELGSTHRSQFMNEASLAGHLRHPHIVAIFDAALQEESGYVAMELVTGGDLSRHVEPGALLPVADVLQIGFKCCGALDYAFRQGIIHRDIKPANIMIVQGTHVKIADFGAAHMRRNQAAMEQTAAIGSPYYMAPEQIEGAEPNYHSDLYSLGVVLYQLLTGALPFTAASLEMLAQKIMHQEPVPPSKLREGLPKAIDDCVLRAMKKDRRERYDYYGDFALDLAKAAKLVEPAETIPDSERHVALKHCEMLSELADAELWELVRAGRWSRASKGSVILTEGDEGDSCFFLAEGSVKVHRKGILLNLIKQSECFGEMGYIRGGDMPRQATVEAASDVLLAEFRPLDLIQVSADAQLHLTRAFVRNLVDRLQLANAKLTQ